MAYGKYPTCLHLKCTACGYVSALDALCNEKLIGLQSCITEAQKYEKAMSKEKSNKRKSVSISEPPQITLQAYVEDALNEDATAVALVSAPPRAPSPPPSAGGPPTVNVFDFLVNEETPNASRMSLNVPREQMQMVAHAPPLFKSATTSPHDTDQELDWEDSGGEEARRGDVGETGFEYGVEPVPTGNYEMYRTPAPKKAPYTGDRKSLSTDKKRKRQVEDLDLTQARRSSQELDEEMPDIDHERRGLHTGLTGGLTGLMSMAKFPPSPEYSAGSGPEPSPLSPAKRKRATLNGATVERRGRAANGQLVKVRKIRRASDESRPRKHHRSHKHRDHEDQERLKRPMKAIEYHRNASPNSNNATQLVIYQQNRAEMFLGFVTKGPESEHGYSLNKALKRYHRERGERGLGKQEEEKELFKNLRLKRNERGEVVVFIEQER